MGRNSLEGKWKEFFTQRILVYHNQFSKAKTPTMKLSSTYGQSVVVFHKSCFATFPLTPITKSSFEKSAGALGAAGPRWDPFVNAHASSADLAKLSKRDGLGARAAHIARGGLIQI
jgi:hypothetical protein